MVWLVAIVAWISLFARAWWSLAPCLMKSASAAIRVASVVISPLMSVSVSPRIARLRWKASRYFPIDAMASS